VKPSWLKNHPDVSKVSEKYGLEPELVHAVIQIESAGNRFAIRHEPQWSYYWSVRELAEQVGSSINTERSGQATSWGLMQVMGTVAREHGFRGWFPELCEVEGGIDYGCRHLKVMAERWGTDPARLYAAYNAGSVRMTDGGMFVNQLHVDRFMRYYRELTDITD